MPITVTCPCGFRTQVKDDFAGKRSKCPQCQGPIVVPRPEAGLLDVDDVKLLDEPDPAPKPAEPPKPVPKPAAERPKPVEKPAPPPAKKAAPKQLEVVEDFEVVEDVVVEEPPAQRPKRKPLKQEPEAIVLEVDEAEEDRRRKGRKKADEDEEEGPRPASRKKADDKDEEEKPPPRKRKMRRREHGEEWSGGPRISFSPAVASGFGMALGGGAWLAVGLANNRIYIYSIVLVVLGLAQIVRGFLGMAEE